MSQSWEEFQKENDRRMIMEAHEEERKKKEAAEKAAAEEDRKRAYLTKQYEKLKQARDTGDNNKVSHYREKIEKNGGDPDADPNKNSGCVIG